MEKDNNNPICEDALEHGIMLCRKYKKEGKTLDDLIKHLENQLSIIKMSKFMKNEIEIDKLKC